MNQTLAQLGQLLLGAIPTILIFVVLHYFLKAVLYAPLREVLAERSARIEGKLELARQKAETAEAKLRQYEESVRQARGDGYRGVEARRRQAVEAGQRDLAEAHQKAAATLAAARQQLAADCASAQESLRGSSEAIAAQIAGHILGPARQGANAL